MNPGLRVNAPVLPDYSGACVSNLVSALLIEHPDGDYPWIPEDLSDVSQVALLVLDGLGWNQFQERRASLTSIDWPRSPDHHGVPDHDGHSAHLDYHRVVSR